MGNYFSTLPVNNRNTPDLDQIRARLADLEKADQNQDGVITKDEFLSWKEKQQADLDAFKTNLIQMKDQEYHQKISDLKKELTSLKSINKQLNQKLKKRRNPKKSSNQPVQQHVAFSDQSRHRIQEVIDRMIANEAVNIKYLPDIVERQLYKNIFNILLGLLSELVEGSSFKLIGHEITLNLKALDQPKPDKKEVPDEKEKQEQPQL